jgi:hypothetical protein
MENDSALNLAINTFIEAIAARVAEKLASMTMAAPASSCNTLFTAAQAAKYLGCGRQKVRRLVRAGAQAVREAKTYPETVHGLLNLERSASVKDPGITPMSGSFVPGS